MQIITPPTDNLYKFVAITGLVLVVLPLWHAEQVVLETETEVRKLDTIFFEANNASLADADVEQLDWFVGAHDDVDTSTKDSRTLDERRRSFEKTLADEIIRIETKLHEKNELTEEQKSTLRTAVAKYKEGLVAYWHIQELLQKVRRNINWSFGVAIVGAFMAQFGFWRWYNLVQRFHDLEAQDSSAKRLAEAKVRNRPAWTIADIPA